VWLAENGPRVAPAVLVTTAVRVAPVVPPASYEPAVLYKEASSVDGVSGSLLCLLDLVHMRHLLHLLCLRHQMRQLNLRRLNVFVLWNALHLLHPTLRMHLTYGLCFT